MACGTTLKGQHQSALSTPSAAHNAPLRVRMRSHYPTLLKCAAGSGRAPGRSSRRRTAPPSRAAPRPSGPDPCRCPAPCAARRPAASARRGVQRHHPEPGNRQSGPSKERCSALEHASHSRVACTARSGLSTAFAKDVRCQHRCSLPYSNKLRATSSRRGHSSAQFAGSKRGVHGRAWSQQSLSPSRDCVIPIEPQMRCLRPHTPAAEHSARHTGQLGSAFQAQDTAALHSRLPATRAGRRRPAGAYWQRAQPSSVLSASWVAMRQRRTKVPL